MIHFCLSQNAPNLPILQHCVRHVCAYNNVGKFMVFWLVVVIFVNDALCFVVGFMKNKMSDPLLKK